MKLREFLKTLEHDEHLAIGAKDGSSFVCFVDAGQVELMDKCFRDYRDQVKRNASRHMAKLREVLAIAKTANDEDLLIYADESKTLADRVRTETQYILDYIPPLEREVIESYDKSYDNCMAIILEGTEFGKFALKSEFDAKYCKRKELA